MMKRITSLLLALVLVLGMIPTTAPKVSAAGPVVRVDTWQELKDALQAAGDANIELTKNIDYTYTYQDLLNGVPLPEVHVKGNKNLDLKEYLISVFDNSHIHTTGNQYIEGSDHTLFVIDKGAKLVISEKNPYGYIGIDSIIHGGDGIGRDKLYKQIIKRNLFDVYGTLVLNGGSFHAGLLERYKTWNSESYMVLMGNCIRVRDGGDAILNYTRLYGHGRDVNTCNTIVNVDKGGRFTSNQARIYSDEGSCPVAFADGSKLEINGIFILREGMEDLRIVDKFNPFTTRDFEAYPNFCIPDDSWSYRRLNVQILDNDKGELVYYNTLGDKRNLDFMEDWDQKYLYMQLVPSPDAGNGRGKLRAHVTDHGYTVGTKNQEVESITFNPATGTARLYWNYEPYYRKTADNPEHTIKLVYYIWKGGYSYDKYLNPDYIYPVPEGQNYIQLDKMNIPWEECPEWTIECRSTEKLLDRMDPIDDKTELVTVNIDALSFAAQTPDMGQEYTMNLDYTLGQSLEVSFTAKALPASWTAAGYKISAHQQMFSGDTPLYDGNGSRIDLKDYITKSGSYILMQWIELAKGDRVVDTLIKTYNINAVGVPKILEGSVVFNSTAYYNAEVSVKLNGPVALLNPADVHYMWQYYDNEQGWTDKTEETDDIYTPVAGDNKIRVKVTVDGYEGILYSEARTVNKSANMAAPDKALMTAEKKQVTITNYSDKQEYIYSKTALTADEWGNGTPISGSVFSVPEYGTYYVYSRFKETATSRTGFFLSMNWVSPSETGSGESITCWKVIYPEYPTTARKIFVPLGETVTVDYVFEPANANYDLPDLVSSNSSVATVAQDDSSGTLTVTGKALGSAYVTAQKAGKGYSWLDHPNKHALNITIQVYDPEDMEYSDFTAEFDYPDVTLYEGETYMPGDPCKMDIKFFPTDAEDVFSEYSWCTVVSTLTGFYYDVEDANKTIFVDASGKIEARNPGTAMVCLFAMKPEDASGIPATYMTPICSYKVTVLELPEVAVEELEVTPDKLNLEEGKAYQLLTSYSPSNATLTYDAITATSADPTVATVTNDCEVTAVSAGTTTITVNLGGVSDTVEVTVYARDHAHVGKWTSAGSDHFRICGLCSVLETGSHEWGAWTSVSEATCTADGSKSHVCQLCNEQACVPVVKTDHSESGLVYDKEYHWTQCINTGCTEIIRAKENHKFNEDYTCSECGYVMPEEDRPPHIHVGQWQHDQHSHWRICEGCAARDDGPHSYNEDNICTVCGRNFDISHLCPRDHTCPMSAFTDLDKARWYHDGVHYCIDKGLMNGMGNNLFEPDTNLTRAMVVVLLYRMEGSPAVSGSCPFQDVDPARWYYSAIVWATQNGIANGMSATEFAPDASVTREQTATFLYRYANMIGRDVTGRADVALFPDADKISAYAMNALSWAVDAGMITGSLDNGVTYLAPKGTTTRAQYATIAYRFLEK